MVGKQTSVGQGGRGPGGPRLWVECQPPHSCVAGVPTTTNGRSGGSGQRGQQGEDGAAERSQPSGQGVQWAEERRARGGQRSGRGEQPGQPLQRPGEPWLV